MATTLNDCLSDLVRKLYDEYYELSKLSHHMKQHKGIFAKQAQENIDKRVLIFYSLILNLLKDIDYPDPENSIWHPIHIQKKIYDLKQDTVQGNKKLCVVLNNLINNIQPSLKEGNVNNSSLRTHYYTDKGLFNFINYVLKHFYEKYKFQTSSEKILQQTLTGLLEAEKIIPSIKPQS